MSTRSSNHAVTGRQRTLDFLAGEPTDRLPFHPIIMRWAAQHAGVNYRDFCLDPASKCRAMIRCAEDFAIDWVTVMSDPYAEASAFGIQVEYPANNLPHETDHFTSVHELLALQPYDATAHQRTAGRLEELRLYRQLTAGRWFVVGWVEGPIAEYAALRGANDAAYDFMDEPAAVGEVMDMITAAAMGFITLQIAAGADCIGIGDAFGSQIGPALFRELAFSREKALVDHIHSLGAKAKLHICGNTSAILPDMIATGADIIDVDHLVQCVAPFVALLAPNQVFAGRADPVSVMQNGSRHAITTAARQMSSESNGRGIVSAGCEITPATTGENMRLLREACTSVVP